MYTIIRSRWKVFISITICTIFSTSCLAQQDDVKKDQYFWNQEQKLQMIVHIWGEVRSPGQYTVPDGTDILQLISIAGGPTEFSNLKKVKLTRVFFPIEDENVMNEIENKQSANYTLTDKKDIYRVNFRKYLNDDEYDFMPLLKPGDVVKVSRNTWFNFQTFIRVVYQVAIITQGLYWGSRLIND